MPAWTLPRNSTCRQVRERIASAQKERTGKSGALSLYPQLFKIELDHEANAL